MIGYRWKMDSLILFSCLLLLAGLSNGADNCPNKCICNANFTKINCSGKGLTKIPNLPLTSQDVDLSKNEISHIAVSDFANRSSIVHLNFSHNQLLKTSDEEIVPALAMLKNLIVLDLSFNFFPYVPNVTIANLVYLNMSNNKIKSGSMGYIFGSLWAESKKLIDVDLSHNLFVRINSNGFKNLNTPLKSLDLSHNKFSGKMPIDTSAFKPFVKTLEKLNLGFNSLTVSDLKNAFSSFVDTKSLKTLILRGTSLVKLHNDLFSSVKHLTNLDMSSCKLHSWERMTFANLPIRNLDLSNNLIQTINDPSSDTSFYSIIKTLKELKLAGNPFNCDCSLLWLVQWLRSSNATVDKAQVNCCTPKNLNRTLVIDFDIKVCVTTPLPTSTTVTPTTATPLPTSTAVTPTTASNQTTVGPLPTITPNSTNPPANLTTSNPPTNAPANSTTSNPPTTAPHEQKSGFPWWGILLLIILIGSLIGGGFYAYRIWHRRRLLDEGRLPIIGDETA